ASVRRSREDVEVGRQRLDPPCLAQREIERFPIGREAQLFAAAERLRRGIADEIAFQRNSAARELPASDGEAEQARLHTGSRPGVPVADEELVVDARAAGLRFFRQAGAIEVRAPEIAVGPDDDFVTRRRKLEPADVALELADLD